VDQKSTGVTIASFVFIKEHSMNKNKITGAWQTAKGKVKAGVGHAMGNLKMEAEGMGDQMKGEVNKNIGKAKAAVKSVSADGRDWVTH